MAIHVKRVSPICKPRCENNWVALLTLWKPPLLTFYPGASVSAEKKPKSFYLSFFYSRVFINTEIQKVSPGLGGTPYGRGMYNVWRPFNFTRPDGHSRQSSRRPDCRRGWHSTFKEGCPWVYMAFEVYRDTITFPYHPPSTFRDANYPLLSPFNHRSRLRVVVVVTITCAFTHDSSFFFCPLGEFFFGLSAGSFNLGYLS